MDFPRPPPAPPPVPAPAPATERTPFNPENCRPGLRALLAAVAVTVAGGCTALPTLEPGSPGNAPQAVRLESARGPLGAAQGKAALANLEKRSPETGIFERHLAIEEGIVGAPLVTGNRVVLLQDGPATFRAMFEAIQGARNHVHLQTYIIEDDEVGRKFADALVAKRSEGIPVSVIYDSVGSMNTPAAYFRGLADRGIEVLEFNPVNPLTARKGWEVNRRDHRKLLVVDGRTAFVGGINISSVYSGSSFRAASKQRPDGSPPWRDTHLLLEGPVVAEFQKLFLATWDKQKGPALSARAAYPPMAARGPEIVRAIGSSPDEPYSQIYATLISAIDSAETSVCLTIAYFAPDPKLLAALKDAARRGVDVTLILPGRTDSWLIFHAGRASYAELLASGVKIHERRDALLHAKTALIDGVWSTVGSTNLDWRSFLHNDEINAVVLGPAFGAQMQAAFAADLAASHPILPDAWAQRPLGDRVRETAALAVQYWL